MPPIPMTETIEIQLTAEQEAAVQAAVECLSGERPNGLTIGGYAGTGKTVLIKSIMDRMTEKGSHTGVAAFAGKAVEVLRRKGIYRAQTLHSLMYKPDKVNGQLTFHKVIDLDCDCVIVDEASMINTALYEDLRSFQVPVVFVGDHGQLEPIGDNPRIMERPDIRLEKIHRQAEGSAILWLAHLFREGKRPNWRTVDSPEIRLVSRGEALARCHEWDAIICGFNKTRIAMNHRVRANRGFTGDLVEGERLICLKNSRYGFFNGMMFSVEKIHGKKQSWTPNGFLDCFDVDVKTDDGNTRKNVTVWLAQGDSEAAKDFDSRSEIIVVDYGYAITCHKGQGSQYDSVLVLEEVWAQKWDWRRWTYTAATRAAKKLGWVNQ